MLAWQHFKLDSCYRLGETADLFKAMDSKRNIYLATGAAAVLAGTIGYYILVLKKNKTKVINFTQLVPNLFVKFIFHKFF